MRYKKKTVWAYLDGKKLVDVVQAALCNRTRYLRNRDTAGQAGETVENQRRGAGNG